MQTPLSHTLLGSSRNGLIGLLAITIACGCGRDEVKTYTVPKTQSVQANLPANHPEAAPSTALPKLKWTLPEGWQEGAPSEFRVASFKMIGKDNKQADVSVIPLPGVAGGDLSNVNRWRGQVGLQPVTAEELKALAQPVEVAGQAATLYEQDGESPAGGQTRILAVVQNREGVAWFFKMTGDSKLVAQEKASFVAFLKSVQFTAGEAMPSPAAALMPVKSGELPAGHPDISAMPATAAPGAMSNEGKPTWTAPSGWKEVSGGQFLVAKFTITGEGNAQAAVNVSSSAGDGGGLAANVNRWRKQLGLSELTGDELAKSIKTVNEIAFVEMSGTDARSGQPAALVGALVTQPGHAWFYKLMGDASVVATQKEVFTKFVQEVKY